MVRRGRCFLQEQFVVFKLFQYGVFFACVVGDVRNFGIRLADQFGYGSPSCGPDKVGVARDYTTVKILGSDGQCPGFKALSHYRPSEQY